MGSALRAARRVRLDGCQRGDTRATSGGGAIVPSAPACTARLYVAVRPFESVPEMAEGTPCPRLDGPDRPAKADGDLGLG